MGRYPDAEKQLLKAINIAPKDPDIRLLLATVYQMNDQRKEAITQLKEALTFAPDHSKLLYFLSELYAAEQTPEAQKERFNYLLQLVQHDPGNLVPHLDLIDLYIKKGESDKAMEQMELIRKQFPEFPKEAMEYYNKVIPLLRKGDNQNALVQYTIFYNYLKVSAPYQAGMMEFKGPGGSLVGFPLISYDQQPGASSENKSILDVIKFTNVTATSGLNIVPSSGAVQNVNTIIAQPIMIMMVMKTCMSEAMIRQLPPINTGSSIMIWEPSKISLRKWELNIQEKNLMQLLQIMITMVSWTCTLLKRMEMSYTAMPEKDFLKM
jgi:hypothetical protein